MAKGNGLKDEIKEQRSTLKGKGFKAHFDYYFYYYKFHALVLIILLLFIGWFVHDSLNSEKNIFYAIAVNSEISQFDDSLESDFSAYLGLDTEKNTCRIDNSVFFDTKNMNANLAAQQRIMTLSASGSLDVLTADKDTFLFYVQSGLFADLRDYYSEEELLSIKDHIFYIDMDDLSASDKNTLEMPDYEESYQKMNNPVPIAVDVSNSKILASKGAYAGSSVLAGICYTSEHPDYSKKFIEFLLK